MENIRQLILVKSKVDPSIQISANDQRILKAFNISYDQSQKPQAKQQNINSTPTDWTWPPEGFLKLNLMALREVTRDQLA